MAYFQWPLLLMLFMSSMACTHDVHIRSNPAGAKIYVNDTLVGKSPAIYQEKVGQKESVEVRAEKEGYQTKRISLTKSQWATPQLLATIGGCVCGGLCCGVTLGNANDEIGPLGMLGGLPVLGALYFARQSDSNVYLKLKADKPESSAQKDVEAKQSSPTPTPTPTKVPEIPPEMDPASPLRALPTGYTY
jgi:hypothetical protein